MAFLDITDLVGRVFVSGSGNTGHILLLGDHGAVVRWDHEATDEDIRQFEAWACRILKIGQDRVEFTSITDSSGDEQDHKLYQEFLKKYGDGEGE